jgi:hypothetical protein
VTNAEISGSWIENCQRAIAFGSESPEAASTFWAYETLDRICRDDPERALEIILLAAGLTTDQRILDNLAAGPLEDLLVRNGPVIISRIEELAAANGLLRTLIQGVWTERMKSDIQARIQRVAGWE